MVTTGYRFARVNDLLLTLALLLAGCSTSALNIHCQVPNEQQVARIEVKILEPRGEYGCDDIAFGLIGSPTIAAQTTRLAEGALGAALEIGPVSASARKLVLVAGSAGDGGVVVRGCAEVDGGTVIVTAEPVVTTRLLSAKSDFSWPDTPPVLVEVEALDGRGRRVSARGQWRARFPGSPEALHPFSTRADSRVAIDAGRPEWSGPFRVQFRLRWGTVADFEAMTLPRPVVDSTAGRAYFSGRLGANGELGLLMAEASPALGGGTVTLSKKLPKESEWTQILTQTKTFALFPSPTEERDWVVAHHRQEQVINLVWVDPAQPNRLNDLARDVSETGLTVISLSEDCHQPAVLSRDSRGNALVRSLVDGQIKSHPYPQFLASSANLMPLILRGGCVGRVGGPPMWANWVSTSQGLAGQALLFSTANGPLSFPLVTYGSGFRFLGPADGNTLLLGSPGLFTSGVELLTLANDSQGALSATVEPLVSFGQLIPSSAVRGDFDGDGARDLALLLEEFRATGSTLLIQLGAPDGGLSATGMRAAGEGWCEPVLHAVDMNGDGRDELLVGSTRLARDGGSCEAGLSTYSLGPRE